MAGKTLINNTAYDVIGGTNLINGTSYNIKNGKTLIDGTTYNINFLPTSGLKTIFLSEGTTISAYITYGNGYWVVGFSHYNSNSNPYTIFSIAYSLSLDGPWTIKDIVKKSNTDAKINRLKFINGYFVACIDYTAAGSQSEPRVYYTTDPCTEWNQSWRIWINQTKSSYCTLQDITFADGYWAVCGSQYTGGDYYGTIAYINNITSSRSWQATNLFQGRTSAGGVLNSIIYANGNWITGGRYINSSDSKATLWYSSSISTASSSWNNVVLWNSSNKNYDMIFDIKYINNLYIVYGTKLNDNNVSTSCIAYCNSINGNYTINNVYQNNYAKGIMSYNGEYYVIGGYDSFVGVDKGMVYYTNNIDSIWENKHIWTGRGAHGNGYVNDTIYENGYIVVSGTAYKPGVLGEADTYYVLISYATNPELLPVQN